MAETSRKLFWAKLDNAALIFPASLRRHWSNSFRISVSFRDPVDPAILQQALDRTVVRFPSVCVCLRRSMFWYYLEELPKAPVVREDSYQPLIRMTRRDIRRCAFRVLYYRNRLAVEYFHSVTDGTGGLVFAKNLAAEYVRLRYDAEVPAEGDVKDLAEAPRPSELEDSFQKLRGPVSAPRDPLGIYRATDSLETDRFLHVTLGMVDAEKLHDLAKAHHVSVTAYLTALLLKCLLEMQEEDEPRPLRRKPVKVQIPVNLRALYGGETMRNFVAVANIGVDARLGEYTLEELIPIVYHQMQLEITPKNMQAIFTPNITSQQNPVLRVVPLFLKNIVMRVVYDRVGENTSTMCLSNLGLVQLPAAMEPFVTRVEFVLGPQAMAPYNLSCTSWQGKTFINIVRNSVRPRLERRFFTYLVEQGLEVAVESNDRE